MLAEKTDRLSLNLKAWVTIDEPDADKSYMTKALGFWTSPAMPRGCLLFGNRAKNAARRTSFYRTARGRTAK